MRKPKVRKFEKLGLPIGRESKNIEFVNYANELKQTQVSVIGRTCGRVDFFFPVWVARMTADDADRLATILQVAAREARAAEKEIEVLAAKTRSEAAAVIS
jgi:hypothetical protein